MHIIKGW